MAKSASIYTRVEPEIKERAEQVLSGLGIPVANAVNMFFHQVVLQKGLPFDVKMPRNEPLNFYALSPEQLDAEIEKGFDDLKAGRVVSSKQVREEMQRQFGV